MMNTVVAIGQIFMSNEQIQEMIKEAEKMQGFIGGFFVLETHHCSWLHYTSFLELSLHASP